MRRTLAFLCLALVAVRAAAYPGAQRFEWNWRGAQELPREASLRAAKMAELDRQAIAARIKIQLRPMMSDLEIESEEQLRKAVADTRIKMVDLNGDGLPEVVAQGMVDCSPTGNCPFSVFQKGAQNYQLILNGYGQTFTIQKTSTNGYSDIVVAMHGSATQSNLRDYRYKGSVYHQIGCYSAEWAVLEGDKIRDLKDPLVTPCDR